MQARERTYPERGSNPLQTEFSHTSDVENNGCFLWWCLAMGVFTSHCSKSLLCEAYDAMSAFPKATSCKTPTTKTSFLHRNPSVSFPQATLQQHRFECVGPPSRNASSHLGFLKSKEVWKYANVSFPTFLVHRCLLVLVLWQGSHCGCRRLPLTRVSQGVLPRINIRGAGNRHSKSTSSPDSLGRAGNGAWGGRATGAWGP